MDAQMSSSKQECALGMGKRRIEVASMDAEIKSLRKEFAKGMVQRLNINNNAAVKDA
jgi:hypothetical protein